MISRKRIAFHLGAIAILALGIELLVPSHLLGGAAFGVLVIIAVLVNDFMFFDLNWLLRPDAAKQMRLEPRQNKRYLWTGLTLMALSFVWLYFAGAIVSWTSLGAGLSEDWKVWLPLFPFFALMATGGSLAYFVWIGRYYGRDRD